MLVPVLLLAATAQPPLAVKPAEKTPVRLANEPVGSSAKRLRGSQIGHRAPNRLGPIRVFCRRRLCPPIPSDLI